MPTLVSGNRRPTRSEVAPVSAKNAALHERMKATSSLRECIDIFERLDPDIPDDVDILVEMDKERRAAGERPLIDRTGLAP